MSSYGQVVQPKMRSSKAVATPLNQRNLMKLTLKQKIRNWLMNDEAERYGAEALAIDSVPSIDSNGFRLQVYKANGGIVVETRSYDRRRDESNNGLYVITDDKDLGAEIGKIITMENLRG